MAIALFWVFVVTPLEVGFNVEPSPGSAWSVLGWLVNMMFIVDIVVNLRMGFLDEANGALVLAPARAVYHYASSRWFPLDLITSVPYDRILDGIYAKDSVSRQSAVSFVRIGKASRPEVLRVGWHWKAPSLLRCDCCYSRSHLRCFVSDLSGAEGYQNPEIE